MEANSEFDSPPADITGIFEGGGIKGIALAGAAAATIDHRSRFGRVVGTSAGAMIASLLAAGYGADELRSLVRSVDWPSMLDPTPGATIPGIGQHAAVVLWRGLYKGDYLENTWRRLLADRGVVTFGDLEGRSLRMVATDLTHGKGVVLPDDLDRYGIDPQRFPVARAVRMSAAVPFAFRTVRLRHPTWKRKIDIADGALAAKFPSQLVDFASGRPVLGFRLGECVEHHAHNPVRGPLSLAAAVMSAGMSARESLPNLCSGLTDVITVIVEREPLDFDITPDQAEEMFETGYRASAEFHALNPTG